MSAYLPHNAEVVWIIGLLMSATLLLGLGLSRLESARVARLLAWGLVIGSVVSVERICAQEPAGFRMLAIITALLWGMKAVVSVEAWAGGQAPLTAWRWLAFAALWPGMRPAIFAGLGGPPREDGWRLMGTALIRMALGAILIILAWLIWPTAQGRLLVDAEVVLATALLLVGLSLLLHFGLFNFLAGAWRLAGVDARPLFRAPLASTSLGEFWSRRWNLAFSEMTAVAVYKPLASGVGRGIATLGAFLFSGLLHELAISLPVLAGFGLPMLYFILHGLLVLLERAMESRGYPIGKHPWLGRLWTLVWLALPLPILFHPPFLRGVVWPLIGVVEG